MLISEDAECPSSCIPAAVILHIYRWKHFELLSSKAKSVRHRGDTQRNSLARACRYRLNSPTGYPSTSGRIPNPNPKDPFQRDEILNDKSTKPFEKSVEFFTLAPYLCELSEVWVALINHV